MQDPVAQPGRLRRGAACGWVGDPGGPARGHPGRAPDAPDSGSVPAALTPRRYPTPPTSGDPGALARAATAGPARHRPGRRAPRPATVCRRSLRWPRGHGEEPRRRGSVDDVDRLLVDKAASAGRVLHRFGLYERARPGYSDERRADGGGARHRPGSRVLDVAPGPASSPVPWWHRGHRRGRRALRSMRASSPRGPVPPRSPPRRAP